MIEEDRLKVVAEREFLESLWTHFDGWQEKIQRDFGKESYTEELDKLRDDPVYSSFGFDIPGYVFIRLTGRLSVSIGRRLGEIFDKMPRTLATSRFGLKREQVAERFDNLEIDISLRYSLLSSNDQTHVMNLAKKHGATGTEQGIGIEIRYNFNPNDSARLRKDEDMARLLLEENLFPIFLIFSSSSPREDAIARLTRAGWFFLRGEETSVFSRSLFGIDFVEILERDEIQAQIGQRVHNLMIAVLGSYAFSRFADES